MSERQLLEGVPNIREGFVQFQEVCDQPIIIMDREIRQTRPDDRGQRRPFVVWLVDLGNELVYTIPQGNTDAVYRSLMARHGQSVKAVLTPIPNAQGYMTYKWYGWTEEDESHFIGLKDQSYVKENGQEVPF